MSSIRRALVLIDVQQEYFEGMLKIQHPPREDSLAAILAAIDAANDAGAPVVVVQHDGGESSPVFNPSQEGFGLHPEIEKRRTGEWKQVTKHYSSVFADTDLAEWLEGAGIDTVTLTGYMTNNCILASSAHAEHLGITVEVLSDASGAIDLANDAGTADAQTVHTTLLTLLHSNWAAVATTSAWTLALKSGVSLGKSNLVASAMQGAAHSAM